MHWDEVTAARILGKHVENGATHARTGRKGHVLAAKAVLALPHATALFMHESEEQT
jgi:hypothetical protein